MWPFAGPVEGSLWHFKGLLQVPSVAFPGLIECWTHRGLGVVLLGSCRGAIGVRMRTLGGAAEVSVMPRVIAGPRELQRADGEPLTCAHGLAVGSRKA